MSVEERFWSHVDKSDGCWEWKLAPLSSGYGRFTLTRRKSVRAHRMAWELEHGPIPDEMCVLHECDNRLCVRPSHLFLGTNVDNMRDRDAKGRQAKGDRSGARTMPERRPRGEGHSRSRLTDESVRVIRVRVAEGDLQRKIAEDLGVSLPTVNNVVTGRSWSHVR